MMVLIQGLQTILITVDSVDLHYTQIRNLIQVHVSVLHHCMGKQYVIVCPEAAALSLVGQQPNDRTTPCF